MGEMGGGEHGSVAAEYEQKLRRVRHSLARLAFRAVRQAVSRLFVNKGLYAARGEPFQQWRNNNGEIRTARARDDADGLKGFSWMHVRLRFYPRLFLRACRKYS